MVKSKMEERWQPDALARGGLAIARVPLLAQRAAILNEPFYALASGACVVMIGLSGVSTVFSGGLPKSG